MLTADAYLSNTDSALARQDTAGAQVTAIAAVAVGYPRCSDPLDRIQKLTAAKVQRGHLYGRS